MGFALIQDTATPRFAFLVGRLAARGAVKDFLLRWGAITRKAAQQSAIAKGGRHFWREIARSVNVQEISGGQVQVAASHVAAAQKQYGGVIRAKGKGAGGADVLTIPIPGSEAEGRRAAEFALAGTRLFRPKGKRVLGFSRGGEFVPLFALARETRPQAPDKWFPEEGEIMVSGINEARRMLE